MRKCGSRKFVWYVSVNDYESQWIIAFFDSKEKAEAKLAAYKLDDKNFEIGKRVVRAEVF